MIRIKQLIIHEFRGIRNLTFDMNGDNFAVCGPNGTGKRGAGIARLDKLESLRTNFQKIANAKKSDEKPLPSC